jgi:hypothetical protein
VISSEEVRLMERWDEFDGGVRRAPRFVMDVPLRYRAAGERQWSSGQAANISRSGMLFRAERALLRDTSVEFVFRLPLRILGELAADVVCSGAIVRMDGGPRQPLLAATITRFRFVRGESGR